MQTTVATAETVAAVELIFPLSQLSDISPVWQLRRKIASSE